MHKLRITIVSAVTMAALGAMLSGCAVMTAMSDSPEAVAAVKEINEQSSLGQIAMRAQREDARIAAIKKLKEVSTLESLVCSDKEDKDIRLAAFEQLVALNAVGQLLSDDRHGQFARTIAFPHPVKASTGQSSASGNTSGSDSLNSLVSSGPVASSGPSVAARGGSRGRGAQVQSANTAPAGETFAFPEEWRTKAVLSAAFDGDDAVKVLLDSAAPIDMRIAVAQGRKIYLQHDTARKLVNEVAADKRKMPIIKGLVASESLHKNTIIDSCRGSFSIPIDGRKLLFSFLKGKDATEGLLRAMWGATDDEKNGKTDSENIQFAKWAIANAGSSSMLGDFVRGSGSSKEYALWLIEAVKHIDDDAELEKILTRDSFESTFPSVALAVAQQFKSPEMKAKYGAPTIAKSAPDAATRAKALADVFAQDRGAAYKIVFFWFNHEHYDGALKGADILSNLTDTKIFAVVLAEAKKDNRRFADETVIPGIKLAMFRVQNSKLNALPSEKVNALAASVKARAEKLNGEGKTLVVGNYYIGMPLIGLFALEKTQEVKVTAQDCDFDSEGKNVIVTKMGFDAKNVYAATGIENGDLAYLKIAKKLGLSDFKTSVTKIRRNRSQMNQISEYFGDYSNSFNGGEIYRESTNHAKGVLVTYWDKSGLMEIEALAE